jgi:tetratricopeptide (TPR) repeat protein
MSTADALVARLRANPRDRAAYDALKAAYRQAGDTGALAQLVNDWAAGCEDAREASAAYVEVAGLILQEMGDTANAEEFYAEALQRWPRNKDAALALQRMWELEEDYARVADFLREHAETLEAHGAPPDEIAAVCVRLGDVWKRFGEADEALRQYKRAAELDRGQGHAAYEAAMLLEARAGTLDDATATAERTRIADLWCQAAAGLDPETAIERLERALGYAPWHDRALTAIEKLLAGGARDTELAGHWVNFLLAAPDDPASRERRVRLARAYLAQGQREDAMYALEPAAEIGFAPALQLLEELRGGSGPHRAPRPPRAKADSRPAPRAASTPPPGDAEGKPSAKRESKPRSKAPSAPPSDRASARPSGAPAPEIAARPARTVSDAPATAIRTPAPGASATAESAPDATPRASHVPAPEAGAHADEAARPSAAPSDSELAAEAEDVAGAGPQAEIRRLKKQAGALSRQRKDEEAIALHQRILDIDPLDAGAFDALDAHYRRKQDHHARAALLLRTAENSELPNDLKRARLKDAATVYESRLRDADGAVQIWHKLADLDPTSDEPGRAIKRLLEQSQRWDELVRSIEREVATVPTLQAKVGLLRRLASVHRERRGDLAAAVEVLEQVAQLVPNDRMVRDALLDDLMTLERFQAVVPLLRQQVDEASTRAQKLPLLRKLASVYLERLDDAENAFATYERILELNPNDSDALDAMEVVDRSADNHERLLITLARRVGVVPKERAAELHLEMAAIAGHELHDRDRASELLLQAIDLAPQDGRILDALCALYAEDQRYDDLVETLRERVVVERDRAARAELHRRIARTLRDHLQDPEGEVDAWQKLLDLGEDPEALAQLRIHAERAGDARRGVDILARLSKIERDPSARRTILFDRARLLFDRLSEPGEAVTDLVRILRDLDPDFEPALVELKRACEATGDHRALGDVLERRMDVATTQEARAARARDLVDLYLGKAPDPERAIRALQRWAETATADPEPLRLLVPLLEAKRRFPPVLAALDALSAIETTPEARAEASIRAAQVASTRLRDNEGAWQRLAVLMETGVAAAEQPLVALARTLGRLDALYDLLERGGRAERLLALLRDRVAEEREPAARAPLLRRIAQVGIEFLQDEAGAREAYRALLEIEEDAEALRFLQAIALREDDAAVLSDVLRRLAAIERDPIERRDLRLEQARILRARLGRAQDAIAVLERVVSEHPRFQPAIDELLSACESAGERHKLAAALERLVAQASDAGGQTGYAARLADTYAALGDAKRGITALQKWVESDASNPEPYRRLRPLLDAAGRHGELVATLDALAALEPEPKGRLEATVAAARVASEKLRDRDGAWERLVPLVSQADPAADAAIAELAPDVGRLEELYTLMERAERYGALVALLQARSQREPNKERRADVLRRMARIAARRLDDDERASSAWRALLLIEEDPEALRYLHARARRRDEAEAQVECLARLAAIEKDPLERRDLMFERGHVLRMRLSRPAEAIVVLKEIVERLDPEFEPALDELVIAAEAARDHATLASALDRLASRTADEDERLDLFHRLVDLYEREARSDEKATATLEQWIALRPNDTEPRRRMLAHLERTGDAAAQVVQLDALCLLETDARRQTDARLRAAELSLDRLRDARGAWDRVASASEAGDARTEAMLHRVAFEGGMVDALCELYAKRGRDDELARLLRARSSEENDADVRVDLLRRAALVLRDALHDDVAATEAWEELLAVREDAEALAALHAHAQRTDDPERAADLAGRRAKLDTDPARRSALLFEQASLLADRLERRPDAITILRGLLTELDPMHAEGARALVAIAETADDAEALALGLERVLATTRAAAERAPHAERLADLCQDRLGDPERTLRALAEWVAADPHHLAAHRRLRPHLERGGASEALLRTLDALASLETDPSARTEATIAAAKMALDHTGDAEGAWTRILSLALAGDAAAEGAARELAERATLARPLANLYILRAQRASTPGAAVADWRSAAGVLETRLEAPGEALEAALRALAIDTSDRVTLDEVDRLAVATRSFKRLGQVYGRLVDRAADAGEKVELLLRHADLVERHAEAPALTLELLIAACKLVPERGDILGRAEAIASALQSHAELAWILERRSEHASTDVDRVRELLRAARTADAGLGDREQASAYLKRALGLTRTAAETGDEIFAVAADLDRQRPEVGKEDARRALVRAHLDLGESEPTPFGPSLFVRAATLLETRLADAAGAFDALKQGAGAFLEDEALFGALERSADAIGRLDALDAQLARWIERAQDDQTRKRLLRRRGHLLGDRLGRHAKASEVFDALVDLDPRDRGARDAWLDALERSGEYPALARACMRAIGHAETDDDRVALWRRVAVLWERELKHRVNALEAWRELLALAPDDADATAALARLDARGSSPDASGTPEATGTDAESADAADTEAALATAIDDVASDAATATPDREDGGEMPPA